MTSSPCPIKGRLWSISGSGAGRPEREKSGNVSAPSLPTSPRTAQSACRRLSPSERNASASARISSEETGNPVLSVTATTARTDGPGPGQRTVPITIKNTGTALAANVAITGITGIKTMTGTGAVSLRHSMLARSVGSGSSMIAACLTANRLLIKARQNRERNDVAKLDTNAAWKEASAIVSANREVLLALAGVFFMLPSLAVAVIAGEPEVIPGARPEQMMAAPRIR